MATLRSFPKGIGGCPTRSNRRSAANLGRVGDTPAHDSGEDAQRIQEILSGIPAGCTWLLPVRDEHGRVVDFRVAATSDGGHDLYQRGTKRRDSLLSELYPSMVDGPLWQLYQEVLATGNAAHMPDFRYEDSTAGVVAESLFDVTVSPAVGGLVVWWQRIDEDRQRLQRTEDLGRLGWAEYDLATGASSWSPGMYRIFDRNPALGPMPRAEQAAAVLPEDRGIAETAWQTLDSGAASDVTLRFTVGGAIKHLRVLSDLARDAGGAPLKIHAVVQDVTAREESRSQIEQLRDQLRTREMTVLAESRLAVQLQNMIQPIPRKPLRLPGIEVVIRYLPAESAIQVGGDWYHAQTLIDGRVILAIGDVAGHGLDAVSGMASLRYALRGWLSVGTSDPAQLLSYLNRVCTEMTVTCTAVLAVFDPATKRMQWSRAGHPPPLLARSGTVQPLGRPAGLILGADPDAAYSIEAVDLAANDLVVLFTDGLVERRAQPAGRHDDMARALSTASTSGDADRLTRLVDALAVPNPEDDSCLVAVQIL